MNNYIATSYPCNPYLPSKEHVPDGEPHIFKDRIYVYGSHDIVGTERYCAGSYVGWSCPIDDLANWHYEGVIYEKGQDPLDPKGDKDYYAPDVVQGADGRYYLYYSMFESYVISVAVSESPAGPFEFYGHVKNSKGHVLGSIEGDDYQFDPAVLKDDDGRYYLYSGQDIPIPQIDGRNVRGAMVVELSKDMLTVIGEQHVITSRFENYFSENPFFEASSIRKNKGTYYFIYSALPDTHYLCYATSHYPDRDFVYQGTLVSSADIFIKDGVRTKPINTWGNNHGSILFKDDESYIFYHRNSGKGAFARQGCIERLKSDAAGKFIQAKMTSFGTEEKLSLMGKYHSYIACGIGRLDMPDFTPFTFWEANSDDPYVTEDENEFTYITNINAGARLIYRYFDVSGEEEEFILNYKSDDVGFIDIYQDEKLIGTIKLSKSGDFIESKIKIDTKKSNLSELIFVARECNSVSIMYFEVR